MEAGDLKRRVHSPDLALFTAKEARDRSGRRAGMKKELTLSDNTEFRFTAQHARVSLGRFFQQISIFFRCVACRFVNWIARKVSEAAHDGRDHWR